MNKGLEQVIVALDVSSLEEAIALLEKLPEVSFWKVGLELFVSSGPRILEILKEQQKRIFLDLKFHDIPNTMVGACQAALKYEVDLLTIHIAAGEKALSAIVEAVDHHPTPPKLLGITLLTSLSSRELAFDLKVPLELSDYVLQMTLLAQKAGLNGIVCSPQEVQQLRQLCPKDFLLVCPGIRFGNTTKGDDQSRTLTPLQAFQAGADYLVIGRPITQALDPQAAWQQLATLLS